MPFYSLMDRKYPKVIDKRSVTIKILPTLKIELGTFFNSGQCGSGLAGPGHKKLCINNGFLLFHTKSCICYFFSRRGVMRFCCRNICQYHSEK